MQPNTLKLLMYLTNKMTKFISIGLNKSENLILS